MCHLLKASDSNVNVCVPWLLLLVAVVSCRTDPSIELPFEGSRFVVKALLSPDRPFSARVDHTYPPTGDILFDTTFSNATVVIYENNQLVDTLQYKHNNTYESRRGLKPRAGFSYRLQLTAPGFPDAESQDEIVPSVPTIGKVVLDKIDDYVVSLDLQNTTGQPNQYNIRLTGLYKGRRVELFVEDLLRPDGIVDNCGFRRDNETFFYRDACAVNRQLSIQFSSSLNGIVTDFFYQSGYEYEDPTRQSDQAHLQIRNVTNSYWNYYRTLPNDEGIEQAFLQPTTRYSNVKGGYGIVSAYNERIILLNVNP